MKYVGRGGFHDSEVNLLHSVAFGTWVYSDSEHNERGLSEKHSAGWVTARRQDKLSGFVNLLWDGVVHAWIQNLMVAAEVRGQRVGVAPAHTAHDGAARAGCDFLHVDFDPRQKTFYLDAFGFVEASAGLMTLKR